MTQTIGQHEQAVEEMIIRRMQNTNETREQACDFISGYFLRRREATKSEGCPCCGV